jgi:hypothetical protein
MHGTPSHSTRAFFTALTWDSVAEFAALTIDRKMAVVQVTFDYSTRTHFWEFYRLQLKA